MKTTLSALLLPLIASANWQPLASLPAGNGGFACAFLDHKLIVAGGTNWSNDTKHWLDVIWQYDPAANKWSALGKLPEPRAYGTSAVVSGKLMIAGGSDGEKALASLISIDSKGTIRAEGELKAGVVLSCGAAINQRLFIAGGGASASDLSSLRSQVVEFENGVVVTATELEGPGFGTATAAAANGSVFIFGGARFDAAEQVKNLDIVRMLPSGRTSKPLPAPIRGITAIALTDRLIYLAGGYPNDETGFTDQAWVFDAAKESFFPARPLPIKSMVHLVSDGEFVYCLGGEDKKKHRSDAMWRIPVGELKP